MISFASSKPLGPGDLNILIRDENGVLFDPHTISYSIFSVDVTTNVQSLMSQPDSCPYRDSVGTYHVSMSIPSTWSGQYNLVWKIARYFDSPFDTIYEEFQVVNFIPATSSVEAASVYITQKPTVNSHTAQLVMMVRELLSDTNPDRNYHFRPPTPGKQVAGFTSRAGFIWLDSTIITMIKLAIAQMNMSNVNTTFDFTIDSAPTSWAQIACLGAAAKCLSAEGARWIAEQFEYSLNGVSISLNKAGDYTALATAYAQEFKELTTLATANRNFSAGLRQARWLI